MGKPRCHDRTPPSNDPRGPGRGYVVRGPDDVVAFLRATISPPIPASNLFFGLDDDNQLVAVARRLPDDPDAVGAPQLAEIAHALHVTRLVRVQMLAPGATVLPNSRELDAYRARREGCRHDGVALLDHLLVSGDHWRSLQELTARDA